MGRRLHCLLPAPVAQGIERAPPEREAAGSNPAGRIIPGMTRSTHSYGSHPSQLGELFLPGGSGPVRGGGRRPRRVLEGAVRPVAHDRSLHRSRAPRPRRLERGVPTRRRRRRLARQLPRRRGLRRPARRTWTRRSISSASSPSGTRRADTSRSGLRPRPHSRTTRRGADRGSGSRPRSRRPASSTSRSLRGSCRPRRRHGRCSEIRRSTTSATCSRRRANAYRSASRSSCCTATATTPCPCASRRATPRRRAPPETRASSWSSPAPATIEHIDPGAEAWHVARDWLLAQTSAPRS